MTTAVRASKSTGTVLCQFSAADTPITAIIRRCMASKVTRLRTHGPIGKVHQDCSLEPLNCLGMDYCTGKQYSVMRGSVVSQCSKMYLISSNCDFQQVV